MSNVALTSSTSCQTFWAWVSKLIYQHPFLFASNTSTKHNNDNSSRPHSPIMILRGPRCVWSGLWTGYRPRPSQRPYLDRHSPLLDFNRSASNANRFSLEEDEKIVEMRKSRTVFREIGRALGRTVSSVACRYSKYLVYSHPDAPPVKRMQGDKAKFDQQILQGVNEERKTFRQIGREVGLSEVHVRTRYNALCAPSDRSSGSSSRPYSDAEKDTIRRRLMEGASIPRIANALNRTAYSLRRLLNSLGHIPARTRNSKLYRTGPYTASETAQIDAMKQSGKSWTDIGASLGRSPGSVALRWSCDGAGGGNMHRRWNSAERQELINLFDQGVTRSELAKHFNRTVSSLYTLLREELGRRGRSKSFRSYWSSEEDALLARYTAEGKSNPEIAALMPGRTAKAVAQRKGRRTRQPSK